MQTTTEVGRSKPSTAARTLNLDALAALDDEALGRLYARGRVREIGALEGRPTGRMLAFRALGRGALAGAIRRFAGSRGFPWGGKSFAGDGERGSGVNRVHLGGRHTLFPFLTHVAPSVVDGAPCITLDYDLPDNPGFIRAIHDEVREIEPGLYLGPAMFKRKAGPMMVLWFALDTHVQAVPIGEKRGAA